jgi:hypothetical protein
MTPLPRCRGSRDGTQLPIRCGDDLDPRVQASGSRHVVGVVTDDHEDALEPKREERPRSSGDERFSSEAVKHLGAPTGHPRQAPRATRGKYDPGWDSVRSRRRDDDRDQSGEVVPTDQVDLQTTRRYVARPA